MSGLPSTDDMSPSPTVRLFDPTAVQRRAPVNSSEVASLGGKPAKTPIIAGSICGGILLIAWSIGAFIYFRKRTHRKRQRRLAEVGLSEPPPEKIVPPKDASERIVIPPDPAILLGYAKPGEIAHPLAAETIPLKSPHSRAASSHSVKQPSPSHPAPLASNSSKGHKKGRSQSSSKSRPSSPNKADAEDEMTAPLNPHQLVA